jgi:signal transduction histidine kinase
MGTLLSKRSENLIYWFFLGSVFLTCLVLVFINSRHFSVSGIQEKIRTNLDSVEDSITKRVGTLVKKGEILYRRFLSQTLEHSELHNDEAIILEKDGVIQKYFGQIFYFKFQPFPEAAWKLIRKNQDVYFITRYKKNIYFISNFFKMDENVFLHQLRYPFLDAELKYFDTRLPPDRDQFQFDKIKNMFFYSRVMNSLNNQIMLHLKFTRNDVDSFYRRKQQKILLMGMLLILLINTVYFSGKRTGVGRFLYFVFFAGFFVVLYLLIISSAKHNLFIYTPIKPIHSIYEIALMVIFLLGVMTFLIRNRKKTFQNRLMIFVLFNIFALLAIILSHRILSSLNFLYAEFNFRIEYFTLLLVLGLLHTMPITFLRGFTLKKNWQTVLVLAGFQIPVAGAMILMPGVQPVNILVFSLILFSLAFLKRNFLSKIWVLFLISVSVFYLMFHDSSVEKKEFVSTNVAKIFLNQGNYAKFIAREIVHELNLYKDNFPEFFKGDWVSKLEEIWRASIASRENIASGIFAISKDGDMKSFYSYLVPFLKAEEYRVLPLWAIEDTTAEIYGKKLSLAVASTSVFEKSDFLGRIIVQVLNSPELVINEQSQMNIFTLDKSINGSDLSYITLNEKNQILDNPSNINLKNITGILNFNNRWIKFRFMDLNFNGYIFRQNKNPVIIFFPKNTLVKNLSELIRIFFLFSLLFLVTGIRELKNLEWKRAYYSFSIRVFVILILISLLTAIIFSIFSLNFYSQSSEIKMRYNFFERGRTAQNIGNNFVEESGDLTPNHLFLLAAILDKNVNVFERGELIFTSNYRKIIQSEVPVYLHSNIQQLLFKKNQEFVLTREKNGFNLFFKVYDYVFNIEFPTTRRDFVSEKGQYIDFIIVLFFCLLVIGISSAFFFRNKILSPIRELNQGMEEVEKGNLTHLAHMPSEIELKSLYQGFNAMVNGIQEQKKNISEISRMKTLLKMGRRVAHEVKNPLTPIKLSAEQIQKSLKDKRPDFEKIIGQSVQFIIDETEHLKKVSYGFLDFSRLDEINPEGFDLLIVVNEEIGNFRSLYPGINFVLISEGDDFRVVLDKIKIRQVIKNILINSIEAIGENPGEIRLQMKEKRRRISLVISDNGIGLDASELELIFEEDYSTKEIGTGLGLFIVKRIVDLHQGTIKIESRKHRGTSVILDLPKHAPKT